MFSSDIAKWANKVELELDEAVVAVCAKVSKDVIFDTPALTGRLKGNWYASIDVDINKTSETRTESEALSDANQKALKAYGHNFILMNNLPYAYPLEMGEANTKTGYSVKAPQGFVRKNMAKAERSLK